MHILQVATLAGPGAQAGGVWAVAQAQTTLLRHKGMNVDLLAGWLGSLPSTNLDNGASQLVRVCQMIPGQGIRGLVPIKFSKALKASLKDIDVVHLHLARDFFTSVGLSVYERQNIPIVAQAHGMIGRSKKLPVRMFDLLYKRRYIEKVDTWLALSEEEEHQLADYGVPTSRIQRVSNSTKIPSVKWMPQERPLIAFVARLHEVKRPDILVQACLELLEEGYDFDITLAGPDQGMLPKLQARVKNAKRLKNFTFTGSLQPAEVQALYARAWLTILPSKKEVFPMSVVEAMAVGCPIAVTKNSGISAEIARRRAGFILDESGESVKNSIITVLTDPNQRELYSRLGKKLYHDKWSPEIVSDQLTEVYSALVQSTNRGRQLS